MSGHKIVKAMVPPINRIFQYLQSKTTVQIWLHDLLPVRIEGVIVVRLISYQNDASFSFK